MLADNRHQVHGAARRSMCNRVQLIPLHSSLASLTACSSLLVIGSDEYYHAVQQQIFNLHTWSEPVMLSASSGDAAGVAAESAAAASPLTPLPQRAHQLNNTKRVLYVSMCVGQFRQAESAATAVRTG